MHAWINTRSGIRKGIRLPISGSEPAQQMFARKHLFLVEVMQVVGNSLLGLAHRLVGVPVDFFLLEAAPEALHVHVARAASLATWSGKPATAASGRDTLSEPVAAYAANLALTSLSESMARKLAVG